MPTEMWDGLNEHTTKTWNDHILNPMQTHINSYTKKPLLDIYIRKPNFSHLLAFFPWYFQNIEYEIF